MTPIMTRAEAVPVFKSTMSEGKKVSEALCHEKENVVEDGTSSNTFTKVKKKKKKETANYRSYKGLLIAKFWASLSYEKWTYEYYSVHGLTCSSQKPVWNNL